MKTGKKILLTALSATLVGSLTSGLALTAFADTATEGHEFDAKSDVVFEDFDRAELGSTVTASGSGVDLGERPYLHIVYAADQENPATTAAAAIYKQGSESLGEVSSGGTITLTMRSPDSSVALSELYFGARGIDQDNQVYGKTFDQLKDSENNPLDSITDEWQTFEISFTNSYEANEVFPSSTDSVTSKPLLAIHIYVAEEAAGTLDIASVEYSTSGENKPLNEFLGAGNVQAMAQTADSATWWADSNGGTVVKRAVKMTGDSFSVVKNAPVGDYSYAIIEADGDIENLKVETTTDGTTWVTAAEAYDGYSVALTGEEKGFRFSYDGTESVTVKRIYLTKLEVRYPAIAVPVIDATTADLLDDFSVAQSTFPSEWEDMSNSPEMVQAGMNYRIGYHNGDKVKIENGELVFDAVQDDYIQFKFMSKTASYGKYIVFKIKTDDDATLNDFRFSLGSSEDVFGNVIYANQLKAGYQKAAALLDDGNPYKDGDWYYVVADLEESGFTVSDVGYGGLDLYWTGTGKLHIDEIFFCDAVDIEVPEVEKDYTFDDLSFEATTTNYHYSGWLGLDANVRAKTLSFDVVPQADNFDISSLRFEIGSGVYWACENAQGTLLTTDGKKLNELTYTNGQATHVEIDLEKSGVAECIEGIHIHRGSGSEAQPVVMGAFDLKNIKVHCSTDIHEIKVIDYDNPLVIEEEKSFTPQTTTVNDDTYEYAFSYNFATAEYANLEFTLIPGADFNHALFRYGTPGGGQDYWFNAHQADVVTADGKTLSQITYTADTPITFTFNLRALGVNSPFGELAFHTNGTSTGSFKVKDVKLTGYVDYIAKAVEENYAPEYQPQLDLLDTYLDNVAPSVDITTATEATAGDEITIAYNVSDNATANQDLDITVSVTKDGNAVALTDDKFTAAEGVYTVTVTVRDLAGNEATDTIQITVSGAPAIEPEPTGSNCGAGCGTMSIGGGLGIGGGTALLVISMLGVAHIIRKKKQN